MADQCVHGMPINWCAICTPRPHAQSKKARGPQSSTSPPKEYSAADLTHLYQVDSTTGCWIWRGEFRRYGDGGREIPIIRVPGGRHRFCGTSHNAMSRTLFEEDLGRALATNESVYGTCLSNQGDRHACVNPQHHEIRRGAGEMFGRDMR